MPRLQRDNSALTERDQQWAAEANAWARAKTPEYFEHNRAGIHTAADVLVWLDQAPDMPASWIRWLDSKTYQTRYQMVRNALTALERAGYLSTGETVNAKGLPATSYSLVTETDWAIDIEPSYEATRVIALVRGWLRAHKDQLAGVQAIVLTHKRDQQSDEVRSTAAGRPATGRSKRRR